MLEPCLLCKLCSYNVIVVNYEYFLGMQYCQLYRIRRSTLDQFDSSFGTDKIHSCSFKNQISSSLQVPAIVVNYQSSVEKEKFKHTRLHIVQA